ncbi:membrane protein insertion efficiency factor YidD [Kitasatospora sp. NPDC057223]|uniref:membrane protein insertion efficiency factor YidD n=1 Tax=Kitasatospora sp. NPDC057223 TaxID=3346055 RepID=UPI003633C73E
MATNYKRRGSGASAASSVCEDGCEEICDQGCESGCDALGTRLTLSALLLALSATAVRIGSPTLSGRASVLFLHAVRRYQRHLSPRLRVQCRYVPSCSVYAADAVRLHGLERGCLLAAQRLRRCRSDVPVGTVDPVRSASRRSGGRSN